MGSNCVPIPGAMGVADYIMIDGFKQLVGSNAANMELLCRGMTFYGSVITSAVIILIGYIIRKKEQNSLVLLHNNILLYWLKCVIIL